MIAPQSVAVLGGGVAGLATAFELWRPGDPAAESHAVTVFEAGRRVGGNLRTEHDDGFTVEWGPNGFLDSEPATLELVRRLGLEAELLRSSDAARHRFLWADGKLQEIPTSPGAFLRTGLLSPTAKLRVASEILRPRRSDLGRAATDPATDESVFAFGARRLGREFAETFLDPMVRGITGGDARRLSLAAAFPRMVELEDRHGSLFRALFALGRERRRARRRARQEEPPRPHGEADRRQERGAPAPDPTGVLHGFRAGIATLPLRLATELGRQVRLDCPVEALERAADGWRVRAGGEIHGPFAAVVDATPAHAAARHQPDPAVRRLLAEIAFVPMAVIALGFARDAVRHPLDGFGMLVPGRERKRLLGVLWSSSIFPGRAPRGRVLLRCMAGGADHLERGDAELTALALEELRDLYGLTAPPSRSWVFRHPRAIAQYEVGHLARLRRLEELLGRQPGLFVTGASYRGVSINHCVRQAQATAATVRSHLAATAATARA